ncbi:MAG: B12-binding domain-containing protein [Dehalococcoidales bacterium]
MEKYLVSLQESIVNLDFDAVVKVAQEAMAAGANPHRAINEGMVSGMAIVGEKFEKGEYFLSELVVAAEVMKEGLKVVNPYLKGEGSQRLSKVVIATVEGDYHDLGKGIVTSLLRAHGFEVVDLGVDVATERIIDAVKEHQPTIVGMSALLTLTMPKMGGVIEALKAANFREKVKVILGGTPVTSEFAESIGADHRAVNALEGVKKCVEWVTSR